MLRRKRSFAGAGAVTRKTRFANPAPSQRRAKGDRNRDNEERDRPRISFL